MLQVLNFGHMNTSTIQFESRDRILLVKSSTEVIRPEITIFADIIKTITRYIKQILKDSIKTKGIRNYKLKCNLYLYFLIQQNLLISSEKMLMSAEVRMFVT